MPEPLRTLVIDDDAGLRDLLGQYLTQQGYIPTLAANTTEARALLESTTQDVLVVDVMMPGETGMEFANWYRAQGFTTPMLMLTALADVDNRIAGLESGADDYLAKPFEPRELCLRLEKLVQRTRGTQTGKRFVRFGGFVLDMQKKELRQGERYVALSTTEYALLATLAQALNQSIPREVLSQKFHGISERSIDVQITRLRRKIEINPKEPEHLITVRGEGYMLRE